MSSRFCGGAVVLSRAQLKWRLTETRSFRLYAMTSPVCNGICLKTVFNSNILVSVTERGDDGTTVYDHVIEDKGRKIKIIFNILDGPRREQVLPVEPESQLSRVKRAAEEVVEIKSIRDRLGASVTYLEGLLGIGDVVKDVSRSL